jgi:4-amino-4-deoxy-L-arabinose transferase-like glycosyltransferase
MTKTKTSLAILFGALLIYCAGLREAVITDNNIHAAEAVRAMAENGEFTTFSVFLMHCTTAAFGGINPLTLALPGAIAAALLLVCLFQIGSVLYSTRIGTTAALIAFCVYPLLIAVRTASDRIYLPLIFSAAILVLLILRRKKHGNVIKIALPLCWLGIAVLLPNRLHLIAPLALITSWLLNFPWHTRWLIRLRRCFFRIVGLAPLVALLVLCYFYVTLKDSGVNMPLLIPAMVFGVFALAALNIRKGIKAHDRNLLLLAILGLTIAIVQLMIIEPLEQHEAMAMSASSAEEIK